MDGSMEVCEQRLAEGAGPEQRMLFVRPRLQHGHESLGNLVCLATRCDLLMHSYS